MKRRMKGLCVVGFRHDPIDPSHRLRRRMIDEHSAFLTWAMQFPDEVPRIPRRRVDQGGFTMILRRPGARAAVLGFWKRTLERIYPL